MSIIAQSRDGIAQTRPTSKTEENSEPAELWTRFATDKIYPGDTTVREDKKLIFQGDDRALAELIYDAIHENKLMAYPPADNILIAPMSHAAIMKVFEPKRDTVVSDDVVTGMTITKIFTYDINFYYDFDYAAKIYDAIWADYLGSDWYRR